MFESPAGASTAPENASARPRLTWLESGAGAAARARVRAHPRFREAMIACARSMVDLYDNHPLINRILNDRGRVVFGFLLLHLDAEPGGAGVTAARMAVLCQEESVCSRGRTKALLALMRWGGYLAPVEGTSDKRERPLAPTERMWEMFRNRWQSHFRAMRPLGGEAGDAAGALSDRDFCRALAYTFGLAFRAGFRVLEHAPRLIPFADRDGGVILLMALLVAQDMASPPPTVAQLARRFHLSRAHVLQILRDATAAGLVRRTGGQDGESVGFALSAEGEDALADFFTSSFSLFHCSARQAALFRDEGAFASE